MGQRDIRVTRDNGGDVRWIDVYLGNCAGELVGELSLNTFFVTIGVAMLATGRRKSGYAGIVAGTIGWIAALRNLTALVAPVADLNNYLLPIWLITLGVLLIRWTAFR